MKEKKRNSENGSANSNLLVVLFVLILLGNAAYNYVPVAYQAEVIKEEMQKTVIRGVAIPTESKPPAEVIKKQLDVILKSYDVPTPYIDVRTVNSVVYARVWYLKKVQILPFGIYERNYEFDYTTTPAGFLIKEY